MKQKIMKRGTARLTTAIFFLALMMLAPAFLLSAADGLVPCGGNGQNNPCAFSDFFVLINNVINFLLFNIATPLAALTFAVAGWMYLTAGGDTGKIKQAHELFKNVAIGFIIALSAWLIVKAILLGLGIQPGFSQLQNVGR